MIKSLQFVKETVEVGGNKTFVINPVDPAKTVVMMFGNSYISDNVYHYNGTVADGVEQQVNLSPNIDPVISEVRLNSQGGFMDISEGSGSGWWQSFRVTAVTASYVKIKLESIYSGQVFGFSIDIIEHRAQTVYPVIDSVAAEAVVISWSNTPSVAAAISLIVIEYI